MMLVPDERRQITMREEEASMKLAGGKWPSRCVHNNNNGFHGKDIHRVPLESWFNAEVR